MKPHPGEEGDMAEAGRKERGCGGAPGRDLARLVREVLGPQFPVGVSTAADPLWM